MSNPYKNRPNNTAITGTASATNPEGHKIEIQTINRNKELDKIYSNKEKISLQRVAGSPGVQNADALKAAAMAQKRDAKAANRNSVETIKALTNRIAALEATVARLVNCYPLCSITPTPTITRTVTPTVTPTKSHLPTPSVTPSRFPNEFVTATPTNTPTKTPTQTPTQTASQTPTPTPTATPSN